MPGATYAAEATSQQRVPQVTRQTTVQLIDRYDNAVKKNATILRKIKPHKKNACNLQRARKYISTKRKATWGWQDKLLMPQTPTSYNERHSKGCGYLKWSGKRWAKRAHKYYSKYIALQDPQKAICYVFGSYCDQALAVSWCEGRHYVWAHNGQYLGMFQMGSYERGLFGHGNTPLEQAVAAHRYFVASGKDWSPWSCKPW